MAHLKSEIKKIKISDTIYLYGNIENESEAIKFAKSYDWHTWVIDDNTQMKKAERNNEWILSELKKLGATRLENTRYTTSISPTPKVLEKLI